MIASLRGPPDISVLVVDDDADAREGIVRMVKIFGVVRARAACDGEEALDLLPDTHPDLILCDLQMPRLDGFGFVRRLRRAPPFHRTLTVAVTGLSRATDIAATRTAGFDGHLIKPITLEMIDRLLERAVEGHRGADQPFWTPDFLARRPVIDPQTLFARIRQRMASGTLPCDDCTVTWYGEGRRRLCAACDQRILGTDTEIECDLPRGGTICFHQRCYDVWHSALTP